MNTIHSIVDQITETKADYELIAQILCEVEDYGSSKFDQDLQGNIAGFALKLSRLKHFGLTLSDVLSLTQGIIVIDAEYQRLDTWIISLLDEGSVRASDLNRLLLTIQVRRSDAEAQMAKLSELGIRTILVAGNNAYLDEESKNSSAVQKFVKIIQLYSYDLLGINHQSKVQIEKRLGMKIENSQILELLGYQSITGSLLWTYYAGSSLTSEAEQYISRRQGSGHFLARSKEELSNLVNNHKLVIFVDAHNSFQYLQRLRGLSKLV